MANYNFVELLSPTDFENLTRDLLQAQLGLTLESFAEGKDGGVDFRYFPDDTGTLIVQCKRYRDYDNLKRSLEKEVSKVEKLKPVRYLLSTSVSLTPENKKRIYQILSPFIQNEGDIYGKEDLNNLLQMHPDILKRHYKLWLSDAQILEQIIHSDIEANTFLRKEEIRTTVKRYVPNPSLEKAQKILNQYHYVIISGAPGIGKTTLAHMLVYLSLTDTQNGQFICTSSTIQDVLKVLSPDPNKKQIFLIDDCFGSNFLDSSLARGEDNQFETIVKHISNSKNKYIIFTTREYILTQVQTKYDKIKTAFSEQSKCLIDLENYTKKHKADILYNQIAFSRLPNEYIQSLLKEKTHHFIINHKAYTPRLIEPVLQPTFWEEYTSSKFPEATRLHFEDPNPLWISILNNHISSLAQIIIYIFFSTGAIYLEDLKKLVRKFASKYQHKYNLKSYDDSAIDKAIQELENTFIKTTINNFHDIVIQYLNPSVQDVLVIYMKNKLDTIYDILDCAEFCNQFFTLFEFNEKSEGISKVKINREIRELVENKVTNEFDSIYQNSTIMYARKQNWSKLFAINLIIAYFPLKKSNFLNQVKPLIWETYNLDCVINTLTEWEENLFWDDIEFQKLISQIYDITLYADELETFDKLEMLYGERYTQFTKSSLGIRKLNELFNRLIEETGELLDIKIIEDSYNNFISNGIFLDNLLDDIDDKFHYLQKIQDESEASDDGFLSYSPVKSALNSTYSDTEMDNKFATLLNCNL